MASPLYENLALSALGEASPRTVEILAILGQGNPEQAVLSLFERHPSAQWCQRSRTVAEDAVDVLNVVVAGADFQRRLPDEGLADLCSFFIQRLRFSDRAKDTAS